MFQDHLIDAMIVEVQTSDTKKAVYLPDRSAISTVYQNTMPGDPIRCLLADMHIIDCQEEWFGQDAGLGDAAFVEDLARGLLREKGNSKGKSKDVKMVLTLVDATLGLASIITMMRRLRASASVLMGLKVLGESDARSGFFIRYEPMGTQFERWIYARRKRMLRYTT